MHAASPVALKLDDVTARAALQFEEALPDPELARGIAEHGERAFPLEACGAVIGRTFRAGPRAVPAPNSDPSAPSRRYRISPEWVRGLEQQVARSKERILGFYHTHPYGPALPSEEDHRLAWPGYTYLILSVENGTAGAMGAFRWDERSHRLVAVSLFQDGSELNSGGVRGRLLP
jgi:proteasome lid subunit RPN8/RPN11